MLWPAEQFRVLIFGCEIENFEGDNCRILGDSGGDIIAMSE